MVPYEIRIALTGHVDHGKSTLLGELVYQCNALSDDRLAETARASSLRGRSLDLSMVSDALSEERDQAMTWDTTQVAVQTHAGTITFIDTPGHQELIGNMLTGAGLADAAIMVVDVTKGVQAQTCLHLGIVRMLGVQQVILVINKMDSVDYEQQPFEMLRCELHGLLRGWSMAPACVVPVSALAGENITRPSRAMEWYKGPPLLRALESLSAPAGHTSGPTCFPVQHVWETQDGYVYLGRLDSGNIFQGQRLTVLPENSPTQVAMIKRHTPQQRTVPNECLGLILTGNMLCRRGQVLCSPPGWFCPACKISFELIWLAKRPLRRGYTLTARVGPQQADGVVSDISTVDPIHPDRVESATCSRLDADNLAVVSLYFDRPLVMDQSTRIQSISRAMFYDHESVCAVGRIASS